MLNPDICQAVLQRLRELGWNAYSERRDFVVTRFETAVGEKQASAYVRPDPEFPGQYWIRGSYCSNVYQDALSACYGFIPAKATTEQIEAAVLNFHTMAIQAIDGTFARSLWLRFDAPAAARPTSVGVKPKMA